MRKLTIILLFCLIAFPLFSRNKAVLIGVSEYPEESGWRKLSSHNDVMILSDLLSTEWDVTILEDKRATHNGIVATLTQLAERVTFGDTVLVHFSGHGQQMLPIIKDPTHDPDMLDEAIIPYDAKKDWSAVYKGENHLRDDEFGALIDSIREKAGIDGLVIVVLDACHSDSMQKGQDDELDTTEIFRGTSDIFGEIVTDDDVRKRYNRDNSEITINNNAQVVYISACQANSKNAEIKRPDGKRYGSLSFAVSEAIKKEGIKDKRAFLDCIVFSMDTLVQYQYTGIRTSFEYQKPSTSRAIDTGNSNDNVPISRTRPYLFVLLGVLAMLVAIVWRVKKK